MKYENFQGFLKRAIQLVTTKKPRIMFEVTGNVDKRSGAQPNEENSPIYSLTVEVFELDSPKEWLIEGFKKAREDGVLITDDMAAIELCDRPIGMIDPGYPNPKITTPDDFLYAEFLSQS